MRHASIFVDIDNTLTAADEPGATTLVDRVDAIRRIALTHDVVVWSARGAEYARDFCIRTGLIDCVLAAVGKPDLCIDDKDDIRAGGLAVVHGDMIWPAATVSLPMGKPGRYTVPPPVPDAPPRDKYDTRPVPGPYGGDG